jgi:spermidine synthase
MNVIERRKAYTGSRLLYVAIFLSGLSSIIYQLVWTRYLNQLFGVSVHAVATVLTCYMLGLVAGSLFIGRLADRTKRVQRLFLSLEALIGIYGLCSPFLYAAVTELNVWTASQFAIGSDLKLAVRIALSLLFLIIPTFLMGGTFPVMVKRHNRMMAGIGKDMGAIYAVNTLGAAFGAFVTGFYLIQWFGLNQSVYLAAGLNLLVVCLLLVGASDPHSGPANAGKQAEAPALAGTGTGSKRFVWLFGTVFALSGFTSLSYEVLWTRSLTYFFRDTVYDFALVLTVFLGGIVLGSLVCSRLLHRIHKPVETFGLVQVAIGLCALISLFVIHKLPYAINHLQTMSALYTKYGDGYWLAGLSIKLAYTLLIVLVPTSLFGATYPLIGRILLQNTSQVGKQVGLLNSLNTLGAAIGSLLSGFVLLSLLGLHNSIKALALLNCGIGLTICAFAVWPRSRFPVKTAAALVIVVAVVAASVPRWDQLRMSISFLEPDQALEQAVRVLYYNENSMDMVSVVEVVPYQQKFLTTNRLYTQNTSYMGKTEDHRRLGHIPLLLHPHPDNVLVIGLGAGMTLSGVGEHPVTRIDGVEISSNVVNAARLFSDENKGILDDPRLRLHIDDGRNFIRTVKEKYDVIIGDIYFPMSSGSSSLYSTDYYRAVNDRLAPDGLFVQWLPIHQLSFPDLKIIIRSFQEEFPAASLWYGMIGDSAPVLGVLGMKKPLTIDYGRLEKRLGHSDLQESLQEMNLATPYLLLSHFIAEGDPLRELVRGAAVNTDNKPIIEFTAPRLYDRSHKTGLANVAHFPEITTTVFPYLTNIRPNEAASIQALLTEHMEAKKTIIQALTLLMEGGRAEANKQLNEALRKYLDNEDLLYWQEQLASRP